MFAAPSGEESGAEESAEQLSSRSWNTRLGCPPLPVSRTAPALPISRKQSSTQQTTQSFLVPGRRNSSGLPRSNAVHCISKLIPSLICTHKVQRRVPVSPSQRLTHLVVAERDVILVNGVPARGAWSAPLPLPALPAPGNAPLLEDDLLTGIRKEADQLVLPTWVGAAAANSRLGSSLSGDELLEVSNGVVGAARSERLGVELPWW